MKENLTDLRETERSKDWQKNNKETKLLKLEDNKKKEKQNWQKLNSGSVQVKLLIKVSIFFFNCWLYVLVPVHILHKKAS
jgi:hypothetical protein